jgi:glyoxalase family protein
MQHPVLGLHHVTATVDDAQADLDFAAGALGLRLVKRTVNFDNHNVFHFYYGNERGLPGTIWTTFPYKGYGVRVGKHGAGQVTVTSFSVPKGSLDFWRTRLREQDAIIEERPAVFGEESIRVYDSSGLAFDLIATSRDDRTPWTGVVTDDVAIRGLHGVTLTVRSPEGTLGLMTSLLGFKVIDEAEGRIRVGAASGGPGHTMDIVSDANAPVAVNGLGTVHHVAMAIATGDEQRRLQRELMQMGVMVTDIRDRCYFESIYFREPGGVLFEVATVQPGFLVDEQLDQLGRGLKLPPWEEGNRRMIEAGLPKVTR